jgi:ATP-dependent Clp protease, protease subunit
MLGSEVNDEVANVLVSQLLYLASADPTADITLYINSPGGSVQAGLAIFDAMQYVPCDVRTVCYGMAASMGAFLLAAGAPGKRKALPNSRIMIHQPLGGAQGEATELEVTARLILHTKDVLNTYLSAFTAQPIDKILLDTDRDFYMTPEEAKDYGLIDEVIKHKRMIARPQIPALYVPPPPPLYDISVLAEPRNRNNEEKEWS